MLTLRLPPEILDHIVDLLQDHPHALNQCCLVSKPWIPRTRKHLFAEVHLSSRVLLKSWKNAFPDPASSPGYHTHTLSVCRTLGDVGGGSWVTSFPRVKQLDFALSGHGPIDVPFAAFHRLSSSIKSLKITFTIPHPHVFNLILSLPLLEDLELRGKEIPTDGEKSEGQQTAVSSPTSPALTGTLILLLFAGMVRVPSSLLDLPGGLHFRKLGLCSMRREVYFGRLYWWLRAPILLNTSNLSI